MQAEEPIDRSTGASAAWSAYYAIILALVLALTAYTHQLDDIKDWIMHVGGVALLCAFLWLRINGEVPSPPRAILIGFGGFLGANLISTLIRAIPFIVGGANWNAPDTEALLFSRSLTETGAEVTWFYIATSGFLFAGAALASSREMIARTMRLWLFTAFLTTLFGLFHYGGGMQTVYDVFFKGRQTTRLSSLIYTFAVNREMLSTILNPQFFGNFLVMVMPVSASAMFFAASDLSERSKRGESIFGPMFWIAAGATGTLMSFMCIYLTFQKSSLYLAPITALLYVVGLVLFTRFNPLKLPGGMLILTCLIVTGVVVGSLSSVDFQMKIISMGDSMKPRLIMSGGAFQQFLDYPILGAGPGSYRILFPTYRDPEYHLHRIANVTAYSHNWMLDILAEVGIVGFAFYAFVLGWIVVMGFRAMRTCPDHTLRVAVLGYLVGLFSILVGNLATPMSRWPVGAGSLHAFMGLAAGTIAFSLHRAGSPNAPMPMARSSAWWMKLLVAGSFVLLLATINRQTDSWRAAVVHSRGLEALDDVDADARGMSAADIAKNTRLADRYRAAADLFRQAKALDENRPTTYYKLGYALNRMDDVEGALAAYEELRQHSPDYSEIHYNLGILSQSHAMKLSSSENKANQLEAIEAMDTAVHEFKRAALLSRRPYVHRQYATTLLLCAGLLGGTDGEALSKEAGDVFSQIATFKLSDDADDRTREEAAQQDALRRAPVAYRRARAYPLALDAYERLLAAQPGDSAAFLEASETALLAGESKRALSFIRRALELNPLNASFHVVELQRRFRTDPAEGRRYAAYMLDIERAVPSFLESREVSRLGKIATGEAELETLFADRESTSRPTRKDPNAP